MIDINSLYDYLNSNDYTINQYNMSSYYNKDLIIVIFQEKNILIKDISYNRKYMFDYNQSSKIIIGFLKFLEKTSEKNLI